MTHPSATLQESGQHCKSSMSDNRWTARRLCRAACAAIGAAHGVLLRQPGSDYPVPGPHHEEALSMAYGVGVSRKCAPEGAVHPGALRYGTAVGLPGTRL